MKKISLGIVVAALLSGCVFQVGSQPRGERDARPRGVTDGPAVTDDNPAVPGDQELGTAGDDVPAPAPMPPWDTGTRFQAIRDGRIVGNIGPALGLDLATDIAQVYDDGFFTEIAVYALRSDGRRVMIQLQVDNLGEPFFVPGVGKRVRPGYLASGGFVGALACEGPDSGDEEQPFEDTPFDEEPCDVGVDTEQNPEDPATLRVTLQATFADDNGDCPGDGNGGGAGDGSGTGDGAGDGSDLPDLDGDGDGDLPDCGGSDPGVPDDQGEPGASDPAAPDDQPVDGGGTAEPLTATTSFTLTP